MPITTGPVTLHYIFYGTWTATQRQLFVDFAKGLSGSPMANVLHTYVDSFDNGVPTTFAVDSVADNYSQGKTLAKEQLFGVVDRAVSPSGGGLPKDPNAVYVVVLASDVNVNDLNQKVALCKQTCGSHGLDTNQSPALRFAWTGNPQYCADHGLGGCYAQVLSPNGDVNVDYMVNTVWHEVAEELTNPNAPYGYHVSTTDPSRLVEIADLCEGGHAFDGAFPAVGPVQLDLNYTTANGAQANVHLGSRDFLVQPIWQNIERGGCVRRVALNRPVAQVPNLLTATTADLDQNWVADVIWRNSRTGMVSAWLLNPDNSVLANAAIATPPEYYQIVAIADYNLDGRADLIWREVRTGEISVWLMNGLSLSKIVTPTNLPLAQSTLVRAVGDFDADNDADILFEDVYSNALYVAYNAFPTPKVLWVPIGFDRATPTEVIGTGDFDGDSTADVLWHDLSINQYFVQSISKGTKTNISGSSFSSLLGIVDVDGDHVADLIGVSVDKTKVVWLKMTGGKPGPAQVILAMPLPQWRFSGASKFTGLDTSEAGILWRNRQTGDVARWLLNHSGQFLNSVHIANGVPQEWEMIAY